MKKYWYELLFRGISPGCQPKGFIDVDHTKGKWGIVCYDRELSENEMTDYELRPWKGEEE